MLQAHMSNIRLKVLDGVAAAMYWAKVWQPYFRMRRAAGKGALILTFHRLVDDDSHYLFKAHSVQTHVRMFEQILADISRHYRVMDLNTLVDYLCEGRPFERDSITVVFDDGYEDNFRLGMPLCTRYGVPAALYVATGCVATEGGKHGALWNDRLEQALLGTRHTTLNLRDLGIEGHPSLNLKHRPDLLQANVILGRAAKALAPVERNDLLTRLEKLLAIDPATYRRVMLTWDEVRGLARAGWEIGSHGISHTIMTRLPFADACDELRESKRQIEEQINRPVRHFAFPNGNAEDFSEQLATACQEAGYRSVASCVTGLNMPGANPLSLRRMGITRSVPRTLLAMERHFMAAA